MQSRGDTTTTPSHQVVKTRRGDVDVVRLGDATGPTAVVVPGLADGLAPLSELDHRAVLTEPPAPFDDWDVWMLSHPRGLRYTTTTRALAEAVDDVLDRIERPVLLSGHSMGGMVAQLVAARRPERVRLLVLSCAVARMDRAQQAILRRWAALLAAGRMRQFEIAALQVAFRGPELARRRASSDEQPRSVPDRLVERHMALTNACCTHDALGELSDVRAPTLVLGGGLDRLARPSQLQAVAHTLPDARLELFPRAAHGLPEQEGERVAAAVRRFVDDHPDAVPAGA